MRMVDVKDMVEIKGKPQPPRAESKAGQVR
jgi:hypothetical protein